MTYRFVDCRFVLGRPERGRELYLEGHVPGAVYLSVDHDLSEPPGPGGRHPLPSPERFAAAAARAGIGEGVFVVAYDGGAEGGAARLWWLLRHFGHEDVAVLDGGIGVWRGPLRADEERAEPVVFVPRPRGDDTIEADELAARVGDPSLVVLDARIPARFRGEPNPIDRVPGRIPGARNAPYTDLELPDGVLDARELAVYCGSGVTACVTLLRLHAAGRTDARLYSGSWSEWEQRGLPVERGERG